MRLVGLLLALALAGLLLGLVLAGCSAPGDAMPEGDAVRCGCFNNNGGCSMPCSECCKPPPCKGAPSACCAPRAGD